MYIKKFIIMLNVFCILSSSAMLNPLKTRVAASVVNKINAHQKFTSLQKRFCSGNSEDNIFNKNPSPLHVVASVPAGMAGCGVGTFLGTGSGVGASIVPSSILGDNKLYLDYNDKYQTTGAMIGGVSGMIAGGIVAAGVIGGVPGAAAWTTVMAGLLIAGKIKKINEKS